MTQYVILRAPYSDIVNFLFRGNEGAIKLCFTFNEYHPKKKAKEQHEKQIERDFIGLEFFVENEKEHRRLKHIWQNYSAIDTYCQGLMNASFFSDLLPLMDENFLPFFARFSSDNEEKVEGFKLSEYKQSTSSFHFACKGFGDNANAVSMVAREGCPENFMLFIMRNAQAVTDKREVYLVTSAYMFSDDILANNSFLSGIRYELTSALTPVILEEMTNHQKLANVLAFMFPGNGFCSTAAVKYLSELSPSQNSAVRPLLDASSKGGDSYGYNVSNLEKELVSVAASSVKNIDDSMGIKRAAAKCMHNSSVFNLLHQYLRECIRLTLAEAKAKAEATVALESQAQFNTNPRAKIEASYEAEYGDLLLLDTLCSKAQWLRADSAEVSNYQKRVALNAMGQLGASIIFFTEYAQEKIAKAPHITYLLLILLDMLKQCLPWFVNKRDESHTQLICNENPTIRSDIKFWQIKQVFAALQNQSRLLASQNLVKRVIKSPLYQGLSQTEALKDQQMRIAKWYMAFEPFNSMYNLLKNSKVIDTWHSSYSKAISDKRLSECEVPLKNLTAFNEDFSSFARVYNTKNRSDFLKLRKDELINMLASMTKVPDRLQHCSGALNAICEIADLEYRVIELRGKIVSQQSYVENFLNSIASLSHCCTQVTESESPQTIHVLVCELFNFAKVLKQLSDDREAFLERNSSIVTASEELQAKYKNYNDCIAVLAKELKLRHKKITAKQAEQFAAATGALAVMPQYNGIETLQKLYEKLQQSMPWSLQNENYLNFDNNLLAVDVNQSLQLPELSSSRSRQRACSFSSFFDKREQTKGEDSSQAEVEFPMQNQRSRSSSI